MNERNIILIDLKLKLKESKKLNFSFDYGEARWRDGFESGLEIAIETVEKLLTDKNI